MTGRIRIDVEQQPGVSVLHLAGHLGIDAHRELKETCERHLADPVVGEIRLDLAAIDSTDMTAIGLLLVLRERGHALHKRVSLTGCGPHARAGIGHAEMSRFFTVV